MMCCFRTKYADQDMLPSKVCPVVNQAPRNKSTDRTALPSHSDKSKSEVQSLDSPCTVSPLKQRSLSASSTGTSGGTETVSGMDLETNQCEKVFKGEDEKEQETEVTMTTIMVQEEITNQYRQFIGRTKEGIPIRMM